MTKVHALIPAAGLSVRFGGTTLKQYAHVLGKPVMAHSMNVVIGHPLIASVTVALAQDDGIYDELIRPHYPDVHTVTGGDSRARSVLNGLKSIRCRHSDSRWVLVHDAARPCLTSDALDRLLQRGLEFNQGAVLAVPVSDTLKREGEDQQIECTVDRTGLWAAQTPQLFPIDELMMGLESAMNFGPQPTDEAEAMERSGGKPLLVPGSGSNIKITCPEDLILAEFILTQQKKRAERQERSNDRQV